jgi:hypothetical protein
VRQAPGGLRAALCDGLFAHSGRWSIPLNVSAIEVLDRLGTEGKVDRPFINLQTRERLTAVNKVWGRLRNKAGLPHLRLHEFRH